MILGAHIGIADGLDEAPRAARRIGCETLQIFSKSPQMWSGPAISPDAAAGFRAAVAAEGLRHPAVHHGYLINLASPKPEMRQRSRTAFLDEIRRAELLGVEGLIFHPGAHLGSGPEAGVRAIAESLRWALDQVPEGRVTLLLENAAGQGTALCSTLEELAQVRALLEGTPRVGVTLDTCHLLAAGVDFRTPEGYRELAARIDSVLGPGVVRAFHLNDAKGPLGSHLDRHANIGAGEIGTEGFRPLLTDARWRDVPGFLETPLDDDDYARYAQDLATLRSVLGPAGAPPKTRRPARRPARRARTVK